MELKKGKWKNYREGEGMRKEDKERRKEETKEDEDRKDEEVRKEREWVGERKGGKGMDGWMCLGVMPVPGWGDLWARHQGERNRWFVNLLLGDVGKEKNHPKTLIKCALETADIFCHCAAFLEVRLFLCFCNFHHCSYSGTFTFFNYIIVNFDFF